MAGEKFKTLPGGNGEIEITFPDGTKKTVRLTRLTWLLPEEVLRYKVKPEDVIMTSTPEERDQHLAKLRADGLDEHELKECWPSQDPNALLLCKVPVGA